MHFEPAQSHGFVLAQLARRFARALHRRIAAHGVSPGEFPVLLLLWEREDRTQTELAHELAVEQPTMANTLKRMERDGLIERVRDPADRRSARIRLTPRSRDLERTLTARAREANAAALDGLSAQEIQTFLSATRKMLRNLEREE
jgi:DNA-binding MarR family transcriptional regulator